MVIRSFSQDDIPELYEILSSYPSSFHDEIGKARFVRWFNETALHPLLGVEHGQIVAFSYLDYYEKGHYANVCFAKRKGGDYRLLLDAVRAGIRSYFDMLDIVKLTATVPVGHSASVHFLNNVGFRNDGLLRKHAKLHGEWHDYRLFSFLKEDLQ